MQDFRVSSSVNIVNHSKPTTGGASMIDQRHAALAGNYYFVPDHDGKFCGMWCVTEVPIWAFLWSGLVFAHVMWLIDLRACDVADLKVFLILMAVVSYFMMT